VQRKATIVFFIFYFETFIFFMKTTEEVMLLIRKTSILVKILVVENVTFFSCLSNECMKKTRDHLRCYFNLAVFLSDIFKPNVLLQLY